MTVISVSALSKSYRLGTIGGGTLREDVSRWWARFRGRPDPTLKIGQEENGRLHGHEFQALRDVSFEVRQGEILGIIGRNGAGKSTLLKVLSRVTAPTSGEVRVKGRIASLLEVGTGFHPELTGRENIYLNGAILGMTKAEVKKKFDEIVAFSGVEQFIDTPVKRYSSGMYVRLAFAVAAHLEPEILIVDEVLAVGDAEFQSKCLGKMGEVARGGRTILFVSHNMNAIQSLCRRVLLFDDGTLQCDGDPSRVLSQYAQGGATGSSCWRRPEDDPRSALQIDSADLRLLRDQEKYELSLKIGMSSHEKHKPAFVAVDVLEPSGTAIMQALPDVKPFILYRRGLHRLELTVRMPALVPGRYIVSIWVGSHNTETLDSVERQLSFEIVESPTPSRTFPHTPDHGFIVPESRVIYECEETSAAECVSRRAAC